MKHFAHNEHGFTLVELSVVIVIIAALGALGYFAPITLQKSSRDQERADDVASLMRRLEQAYRNQEVGAPSYPSTTEYLADISSRTRTAAKLDQDTFKSPNTSDTSSVIAATSTSQTTPVTSTTEPTTGHYVYQPLKADGTLCTASNSATIDTNNCVRFFFYYRTESSNSVIKVPSTHQQ